MSVIEDEFEFVDAVVAGVLLGAGWALWEHVTLRPPVTLVVQQHTSIVQNTYQLAIFNQASRGTPRSARGQAAVARKRRVRQRQIGRLPSGPFVG